MILIIVLHCKGLLSKNLSWAEPSGIWVGQLWAARICLESNQRSDIAMSFQNVFDSIIATNEPQA